MRIVVEMISICICGMPIKEKCFQAKREPEWPKALSAKKFRSEVSIGTSLGANTRLIFVRLPLFPRPRDCKGFLAWLNAIEFSPVPFDVTLLAPWIMSTPAPTRVAADGIGISRQLRVCVTALAIKSDCSLSPCQSHPPQLTIKPSHHT